jgi:hypothetical protein
MLFPFMHYAVIMLNYAVIMLSILEVKLYDLIALARKQIIILNAIIMKELKKLEIETKSEN